ncbi:relaxase/mobilization nuclease domain-containing protein [Bacteroides hominis]|uniref:relaxase/mobilization nuclease domain-containing protein n=1 Tax=Bacteroides hominis TaxID=2763023 RepID=UPI00294956C5|nr:relaxase/mobilization nuclease domain-containing protein [Bacteroides hominis (ex Liu et al. 2022)]MDV6135853.1 relaxase/mobilization nuclease domain-containing protein [Bacteroides hominis (ex Liu et al. 2022)]MDV6153043.1 relaxase/mobilization nuclease domain-containing protein [Bacteroides hominis (ex Liu et al. 2022)]
MIGKQTKGTSFSGCVCYVLREDKSKLLEAIGVEGTPEQMAEQFELQTLLNDKVKNTVGHISLNFSPEDGERLHHDNALMLQIAHDYMEKMGIPDTQYIIARHTDREHPHCHIVFNRVDNDGKTISDKNDFYRNEKACKMLTAKYRLHFANGKDNIKEECLRPYDKAKHEVYKALKEELPNARNWEELKDALSHRDIELKFKVSRTTREVQGVKFEYGGISFSGSKVSREFSYMNIDYQLGRNAFEDDFNNRQTTIRQPREEAVRTVPQNRSEDNSGSSFGLFGISGSSYNAADAEANQEMAEILRKKKKAKRKRGMRL